jgi:hypothetical protein
VDAVRLQVSLTALLLFVTPPSTSHPAVPRSWLARYDLQHPTHVVTLPRALVEVSGLAAWDATHLLAHNDERPTLFVVRTEDGRIVREIRLGLRNRNGDYEDIALDGRHGFLAESDGSLLEFTLDDTSTTIPYRRQFGLPGGICEVESLALAVSGPGLVVACKRVRGLRSPGGLTLFRWQRRRSYDLRPFVRVPWAAFGGRGEANRFAASGMVRTPDGTGWLIVDGPNGRVAELSGDGRVVRVSALPRHLLPQTEGITFGIDGTLYLASEGHYGPGVLAAYAPTGERPEP